MSIIVVEIDGAVSLEKNLLRAAGKLTNSNILTWFYSFADPYMRTSFRKSFETKTSPDGKAWEPLKDSTILRKGRSDILRKTGGLMRSVTQKRGEAKITRSIGEGEIEMTWGDNIKLPLKGGFDKYAIHQLGAPRKNIPARPMIGFRKGDSAYLGRSLGAWITNQLRSAGL